MRLDTDSQVNRRRGNCFPPQPKWASFEPNTAWQRCVPAASAGPGLRNSTPHKSPPRAEHELRFWLGGQARNFGYSVREFVAKLLSKEIFKTAISTSPAGDRNRTF